MENRFTRSLINNSGDILDIDLSIDVEEVTIIIKDFIKTYIKNSNCKGAVVGLSGGIDSTLTAILCRQALGKKNTTCIFLPDITTPDLDYKHYKKIVKNFDLFYIEKDITNMIKDISKNCLVTPDKYVLANVKARARMILLFEYANVNNFLVCGTSNKSEILVGYFTKYGDGGADIMPIGDLYKTQLRELAKYLEIPDEIINKPPTAGLWKEQLDEKDLKLSYDKLDMILAGLERKIPHNKIADIVNLKKSDVERIQQMRISSQHKRRLALIPKIGLRTPGYDWRSPVQMG
jgi:NAD+ synthase